MTYLIIDTNAWIYLCNAYGMTKDATGEYPHIKMFNALKDMTLSHKIIILSNDIILAEWNRNKEHSRDYIKKLQAQRQERINRLKAREIRNDPDKIAEINADIRRLNILIEKNEQHIVNVEDSLLNHTEKYDITNNSKIVSADQAIAKKAPFCGKKSNSMADMVILLSGVEYIVNHCVFYKDDDLGIKVYANNYFVSANKTDFSSPKDETVIHDDIKPYLSETSTGYYSNLGNLINDLSDRQILDDEDLQDYNTYSSDYTPCPFCPDEHLGTIHFSEPLKIRDERYPLHNPEQLRFSFDTIQLEELNRNAYVEIREGRCEGCGSYFIQCACCGEAISIDFCSPEKEYVCDTCLTVYRVRVKFGRKGDIENVNYSLLVENGEDES